jgi:hypothetical protein
MRFSAMSTKNKLIQIYNRDFDEALLWFDLEVDGV